MIASVAPSFAYADQALAPGTTYYYVVTATNGTAEGIGAQATAWTFGPPRTGPTGISIVPGAGSLSLSWSPPTDDGGAVPTDYSVYAATGSTQATDGPGLVGHEVWTLQMDADDAGQPSAGLTRDAGPGGEHGVLHGVSATTGRFGAGYRFAGVNQWISVPDTVAMPQGTIMVWVNASDLSQEGRIVFKEDPGTWIEMLLNTDPTTHYIGFETDHAAPSVISSTPLQAGVWTHIAATWGPGGRALYINGVLDASDSSQVGVGSRFTQTMIGNSPNDVTTGGFNGVLDEFREYDVQLDADMINTIMMTPYLTSSQLLSHTGTTTSYSDRGLGPLTMRSYRLAASNGFGEGALSAPAIGVTLPTSIMPSGLTVAVGPGEGQLSLAWDAPTDPSVQTTGYRIERGSSAVSIVPYVDIGTITTFVDSGIPSGTLEYYDVRALTANGTTDASSIVSARTFGAPLAAPTSPAATTGPGSGDITFTWSPPAATISEPISGFHVLRCDSGDELLADVTIHTFTDHGLGVNSTHCYRVSAFNDYGAGPPSATASATTFALPAAPSTPWTVAGAKSITVRWAPPAYTGGSPISLYRIYASNASGQEEPIGTTTGTTLTETGLANGQKRYYLITAETIAGEGPMSGEGSGKSLTPPGPPRSLKATPQPTTREVLLTWSPPLTANEIPMTSYRVYRGTAPGDDTWLSEVGGRVLTYTDRTCDIGVTCYYRVTAVGAAGEGPKSGAASAPGTSLGVGVPGSPSDDSADTARLIGHEITVLQMDSDDYDHPLPGMTSDSSLAQDEGLITGATLTSGRFGEGLLFQGTGQYVSLRDALTSDLAQGTVMMWVNAEDLTPGHLSLLLKVLPGVFGQLGVQVSPDGRVAFFTSLDGGSTTLVSGPGSVRAGEWTHIAVTWGPLGKRIIVNGQLVASNADTVGTGELSSVTEIGIDPNDHAHTGFHGVIDEFRIYDAQLADG
ncbi:MAG: LamG-like jellyroll fold domain-containing protein, partial [Candidatus Thermoplasmatota archaeon]